MTFRPSATGNSAATLGDDRLMHFSGSLDNQWSPPTPAARATR